MKKLNKESPRDPRGLPDFRRGDYLAASKPLTIFETLLL